ncbi:MAG: hypothetical protein ABF289_06090 [Clostridiales bacterium]
MQYINVPFLTVNNVIRSFSYEEFQRLTQDYKNLYTEDIIDIYIQSSVKDNPNEHKIDSFFRLLLMEYIGLNVFYKDILKVFIGYDYLMGIHSSNSLEDIIPQIEELGLYVERL